MQKEDAEEQALDIKKSVNLSIERFCVIKIGNNFHDFYPNFKAVNILFLFPSQFPDTLDKTS